MKDAFAAEYPKIISAQPFLIRETGPEFVMDMIGRLARTEDIRFSPDGKKLAIAGYARQSIVIFDVSVDLSDAAPQIIMSDYVELNSDVFNFPHGLDFVDNTTLVVASREGAVTVFDVPAPGPEQKEVQAAPLVTLTKADTLKKLHSPGSVAVTEVTPESYGLLVCNNYRHRITQHRISRRPAHKVARNRIVLERGLNVPDGVALSSDKRFIAISNHFVHEVFIYHNDDKNHRRTKPSGKLKGLDFPHGLRFFGEDRYLMVADAGLPYMRLFHSADGRWQGEHAPLCAIRIMSDEVYMKGHYFHQEGGPKGLDFSPDGQILATTCEMQPLTFHHMPPLLAAATG